MSKTKQDVGPMPGASAAGLPGLLLPSPLRRGAPASAVVERGDRPDEVWLQKHLPADIRRNWLMTPQQRENYLRAKLGYLQSRPSRPEWEQFDPAPQPEARMLRRGQNWFLWELQGRPDLSPMPERQHDTHHLSQRETGHLFPRSAVDPHDLPGARVSISARWSAENITRVPNRWGLSAVAGYATENGRSVPVYRQPQFIGCHRVVAPHLTAALDELDNRGLLYLAKSIGSFVPRHMRWNPRLPMSTHSYGIAFDINEAELPALTASQVKEWVTRGTPLPQQDPRLIAVFERHGFEPGQGWEDRDAMHFEFSDPVAWGLHPQPPQSEDRR